MKEFKGDIVKNMHLFDGLCITTNGTIKKNGACVMGRGIALTFRDMFADFDQIVGNKIIANGNIVNVVGKFTHKDNTSTIIFTFPVKHNWYDIADIELIKKSCVELMQWIDHYDLKKVALPRPGCGNGKLSWENVKPVIEEILDERVYVATF